MSAVNGPKGQTPATPAPTKGAPGSGQPAHAKLPGGVTPLNAKAAKQPPVLQPVPTLKQVKAAAETRQAARAQANAKAENLVELRAHSSEGVKQRYDTRLVDLICQELRIEFGSPQQPPRTAANSDLPQHLPAPLQAVANVTPTMTETAKQEAQVKAASAVDLIEKIEAFVKSQRPGIAITLDGSLGARVEIERLGPKEVAIRLVGKNGPPSPEDIGRIRDEMRARGLKVGALSVA